MELKSRLQSLPDRMRLRPLLWSTPLCLSIVSGQASFSGTLTSKYAESANDFNFSEHFLEGRANLNQWSAWGQLELSKPPEIGVNISGLRKVRVEYFKDNLSLEIGDVYTIWGRGLLLNQVDDQAIDLDTGVRGLLLNYTGENYSLNLISGKMNSWKGSTMVDDFSDGFVECFF